MLCWALASRSRGRSHSRVDGSRVYCRCLRQVSTAVLHLVWRCKSPTEAFRNITYPYRHWGHFVKGTVLTVMVVTGVRHEFCIVGLGRRAYPALALVGVGLYGVKIHSRKTPAVKLSNSPEPELEQGVRWRCAAIILNVLQVLL